MAKLFVLVTKLYRWQFPSVAAVVVISFMKSIKINTVSFYCIRIYSKCCCLQNWKAEVLSHTEIFDDFENYKIELPHEISKTRAAETAECLVGTYKKLNVD